MVVKAKKINPKCRKIEIGVRTLKDITIWPLSMADELSFSSKIVGLVDGYDEVIRAAIPKKEDIPSTDDFPEEQPNVEALVATFVITAIKENLIELLEYVCEEKVTLSDIDNEQFVEICDVIFEMNFEGAVGKGMRLLEKVKNLFPQKTQSENSSLPPATDSNISSDSVTETEE